MIFTILSHGIDKADVGNYFPRAEGRWFRLGAMLKWHPPFIAFRCFTGWLSGAESPSSEWYRADVFLSTPLWIGLDAASVA